MAKVKKATKARCGAWRFCCAWRVGGWRAGVGGPREVVGDAGNRAAEVEVLVERPLHVGVVLGVGLHRAGQALVGEHDDEVDGWPQSLDAGRRFLHGIGELQPVDL